MAHVHSAAGAHRGRLRIVLGISATILVSEVIVGLASNSLALLADAGHVFADVVGTSLALVAIWLAARPATRERSFGFYRFEILAAVLNALLLFGIAGYVLFEAWRRITASCSRLREPHISVETAAVARANSMKPVSWRTRETTVRYQIFPAISQALPPMAVAAR